ncbi:MAG: PadR family transcriptional regulator [Chloroflexi bacterium]|nr:MAG: PadR family transcriptional regulator [Chloroflexota bacterium]
MSSSGRHYEVGQPKRFLQPCLLLLIAESPAHGYDLLERLAEFGFERDPGGLYRALRAMESDGLVRSEWQISSVGPGRRNYELTGRGHEQLQAWAEGLMESRHVVEAYIQRYTAVEKHLQAAEHQRTGR